MNRAAVFVTDRGFLVPSLVAAGQLVHFGIDRIADIVIYLVGVEPSLTEELRVGFAGQPLTFVSLESGDYLPADGVFFHKNHVPVTALARLVIGPQIDPKYEHVVYLDGDIQITADPTTLFQLSTPPGTIGAALGSAWIDVMEGHPTWDDLQALGASPDSYFNSGVLAFRRDTWITKGPEALRFFFENDKLCKTHDQTALNAVFSGNVVEISPVYNFHHVYWKANVQALVKPKIIHFTGPNKPWSSCAWPWYTRFRNSYVEVLDAHPYLRQHLQLWKPSATSHISARLRGLASTVSPHGGAQRRAFVAEHVRTGRFAAS